MNKEDLEAAIVAQGAKVRTAKKAKEDPAIIKAEVEKLKQLKAELLEKFPPPVPFKRREFDQLMIRRFFYGPSFELYGGVAGLYDMGPTGCAIQNNILQLWRQHFILEDGMFEVQCTSLTPLSVFKASGHLDRFSDVMVKDEKTGDCHRADHLLEDVMEALIKKKDTTPEQKAEYEGIKMRAETYSIEELDALFKRFEVKSPGTGNDISYPLDFNMMFSTPIGPTGHLTGFLRPETAQGMFLNFKRLLEFNTGRLPFAAAQIGTAYRNEISPHNALLRVREFTMAEIEHFLDPENTSHSLFASVAALSLPLYSAEAQETGKPPAKMTLRDATEQCVIGNETHAYFLGRIWLFLEAIGIDLERVRFRQHMNTEMAHYANSCWDAEIETSFGWVECVGCAHRGCYDLECHAAATKTELVATSQLAEPIEIDTVEVVVNKGLVGKAFKKEAALIFAHLEAMDSAAATKLEADLAAGPVTFTLEGKEYVFEPAMLKKVKSGKKKVFERKFTPAVIEPSFGIGRILYALLEHSFSVRKDDEQKAWLKLKPTVAPVKCSLLPISNKPEMDGPLAKIGNLLRKAGVAYRMENSGASIGRRYARTDEIGIPFGITIDLQSLEDNAATLRDAITTSQVRISMDEIADVTAELAAGSVSWAEIFAKYPQVDRVSDEDKAEAAKKGK